MRRRSSPSPRRSPLVSPFCRTPSSRCGARRRTGEPDHRRSGQPRRHGRSSRTTPAAPRSRQRAASSAAVADDEGVAWLRLLQRSAGDRLGVTLDGSLPSLGSGGAWRCVDGDDHLDVLLEALPVHHPTWGLSLDCVAVLDLPPARQHLELFAGLNRSRRAGAAGVGAWSLSHTQRRPVHRLTVPLAVCPDVEQAAAGEEDWLPRRARRRRAGGRVRV